MSQDKTAILETFNNHKLIDIIKNYRQYGYDRNLRKAALKIVIDRGISIKDLKSTGNLLNHNFDSAEKLIKNYKKNSVLAFIMYVTVLVLNVLIPAFQRWSELLSNSILVLSFLCIGLFLGFLLTAFQNKAEFYRLIGKKMDPFEVLIFILIGIPFYIFMYFYYRHKMEDDLRLIK